MRIGIDISQLAFEGTGVANFVTNLVEQMIMQDSGNEYVLFYSSFRKKLSFPMLWSKNRVTIENFPGTKVKSIKVLQFKFPPTLLDILWNKLHIFPIEKLIGSVDIFISSDWVQPPSKAKKVTILYDLIVYKYPDETHNQWQFSLKNLLIKPNIVASQKRRLEWVKKEVDKIICISQATKNDAQTILSIDERRLEVITPGV